MVTVCLKFWLYGDSVTRLLAKHKPHSTSFKYNKQVDLWVRGRAGILYIFFKWGVEVEWPCLWLVHAPCAAVVASCCTVLSGRFFHRHQWESVCSHAAVWCSRGDQLGCVAWWQQRVKIESNQGNRFIWLPTVFSLHLSLLPSSLTHSHPPHTPRITGLRHILWNRVLLLLTKARNSICIWPPAWVPLSRLCCPRCAPTS